MLYRLNLSWGERFILIGLIIYFLFCLFHAGICLIYPYDLDNEEGFILNQIQLLRHGGTIYPSITDYPYIVGNYPPVFQLIAVPFSWILGDIHIIGRFISIVSTLLSALLIYRLVKIYADDSFSGSMAGLFLFGVHYIYHWSVLNRVDMLALFFTLLGIYYIILRGGNILIPIICFTLAFYSKPVMLAAPAAVFLYLFFYDDKKSAGLFFAGLLLMVSLLFLLLNLITWGQFYHHVVLYNVNPFHWTDVGNFYTNLFRFYWIFLGFTLFGICLRPIKPELRLYQFYFPLAFLVSLTCGKEGSAVNYLIELIFAGSILMGIAISEIRKNMYHASILLPVLLILQLLWIPHIPYTSLWYGKTPRIYDFEIGRSVERIIRQTDGDILSDDASLLVRSGKEVLFQPFIMSTLARQGIWDQNKFIRDIENKKFSLVILYFPLREDTPIRFGRYTPEIIQAFYENYEISDYRSPYWIHRPKSE